MEEEKGVKMEFSKKIKKEKRELRKIKYKGEEYKVENWAQCDKCQIWRNLKSESASNVRSFKCSDAGGICFKKEKVGRKSEYITL